jgi:hypothetical protein
MAFVRKEKVHSLPEYLELIEKAQEQASGSIWYRGCGNGSYELRPSLYRHLKLKTPDELANLELQLMTRFLY